MSDDLDDLDGFRAELSDFMASVERLRSFGFGDDAAAIAARWEAVERTLDDQGQTRQTLIGRTARLVAIARISHDCDAAAEIDRLGTGGFVAAHGAPSDRQVACEHHPQAAFAQLPNYERVTFEAVSGVTFIGLLREPVLSGWGEQGRRVTLTNGMDLFFAQDAIASISLDPQPERRTP